MARRSLIALLVLVVLVGGLFALDRAVHAAAEQRAADRVGDELGGPVEVTLHGWPVGLRLLTGRVTRAEMTASGVHLEESNATLDQLDVTLHDVRVGLGELRSPPDVLPPAGSGRFEARLSGDATWALADVPRVIADLRISDGAIRLRTPIAEASADVIVRGGAVQIVPRTPVGVLLATDVGLDISDQPGAPVIEEAEINGDTLVLRGVLTELAHEAADSGR
jgi:hypothetical protein